MPQGIPDSVYEPAPARQQEQGAEGGAGEEREGEAEGEGGEAVTPPVSSGEGAVATGAAVPGPPVEQPTQERGQQRGRM